ASMGAALGALMAYWGRLLLPGNLATANAIDWRILGFVVGLTIATGILFGVAPALRASLTTSGYGVGAMLKEGGRTMSGGRSRLGKALVVAQVAISLVLLVGAGLFLRTVRNLRSVDVGFERGNLLLLPINPALNGYAADRVRNVYTTMIDELSQVPGVRAVTASQPALLSGGVNSTTIFVQGRAQPADRNQINRLIIAANFFDVMGIKVTAGRAFSNQDDLRSPKVAIINEAAVRRYFRNENPL